MRLNMETHAWYLDKFGVEHECIVIRAEGLANTILAVLDLEGKPVDVDVKDLYYVPQSRISKTTE